MKVLALLLALTFGAAVGASCTGGENDEQQPGTATPGATEAASPATPGGTEPASTATPPALTPEARPTPTPGAYEPSSDKDNLFGNPGFEEGTQYWFALHEEALQTSNIAHSGQASAYLRMRDDADVQDAKAYSIVQEMAPEQFPELISGFYRVEDWRRGTENQYLQLTVVVFAPTNLGGQYPNYQMHYPLVGLAEIPFAIDNARFNFVSRDFEPRQEEWVYFEANIKKDFEEQWTAVPEGYSKIRVISEVRFDGKVAGLPVWADVYYDDLYMGPADANPNKP